MNNWIDNPLAWDFISKNLSQDPNALRLKYRSDSSLPYSELIQQIEGWQKLLKKFPTFEFEKGWVMPPTVSIEQASSVDTAAYKGNHFRGKKVIDVTGGMGIDAFEFSKTASEITHIECEKEIQFSASTLLKKQKNSFSFCRDSDDFLSQSDKKYDILYADPARRGESGEKVFRFAQLTPNPLEKIDLWLSSAQEVWIKLSPMTDLFEIVKQIRNVHEIHVLGKNREAKEILVKVVNQPVEHPQVYVSIHSQFPAPLSFSFSEINKLSTDPKPLGKYLFDPHPTVKIARPWQFLCEAFSVSPLHQQTRLFTSDRMSENFPGRVFEIIDVFQKIPKSVKGKSLTLATQNHRAKAADLKAKFKCKESEEDFLWATKTIHGPQFILTKKIY